MYENVVNYFEKNLCIENIYFRKNFKKWFSGIMFVLILVCVINILIFRIEADIRLLLLAMIIIDILIIGSSLWIIYIKPILKIYKQEIKCELKFDWKTFLLNEEKLGSYQKIQIQKMERYLKKECKIKNIETIDIIINLINEEIKDKYSIKSFGETWFINIFLPIMISILTIYFSNNNEQQLINIIVVTLVSIVLIFVIGSVFFKIRNINLVPINKKENLLDLKRVLIDIKIDWSKRKKRKV